MGEVAALDSGRNRIYFTSQILKKVFAYQINAYQSISQSSLSHRIEARIEASKNRHRQAWIKAGMIHHESDRIESQKKKSNDEIFPFYQFYQLKRKTIHSIYQKKKCQFFSYSKNKTIFQWQDQLQFFAKVSISQCDHDLFNVCHTCNQIHSRWQRENWTEFFFI